MKEKERIMKRKKRKKKNKLPVLDISRVSPVVKYFRLIPFLVDECSSRRPFEVHFFTEESGRRKLIDIYLI